MAELAEILLKACSTGNRKSVLNVIGKIEKFNVRERNALWLTCKPYVKQELELKKYEIRRFVVKIHKIEEHCNSRKRISGTKEALKVSRAISEPFFLCSWHDDPALDHKDLQGKIFVDEKWPKRNKKIAAYIKNHNIMTVQEAMGPPHYLITRPYCRHWLIPVSTYTVLHNSLVAIRRQNPAGRYGTKRGSSRARYLKLQDRIIKFLENKKVHV